MNFPHGFLLRLITSACLLAALPLRAEPGNTASIEGRVLNGGTDDYVENARVTVDGTSVEAFTESDGHYRLANVPAGPATVRVFYTGLASQTATVNAVAGEVAVRDFTLTADTSGANGTNGPIKLAQYVVAAKRDMDAAALAINEQRFAPNVKTVVSTDEFGSTAESNMGEFLKFMPGLTVNYNGGNAREVSIAGVPTDNVPITLDGFNVASTGSGATGRAVALDFIGVSNASRVEVNYSPTPESQGMALAGSVNIVPRSSFGRSKPVFNGSVYMTMRDDERNFNKTPGPRRDPTRKVRPGFDFSWIVPVNDRFGFTVSAGSSNNYQGQRQATMQWRGAGVATNGGAFPTTTVDRPYLTQYSMRVSGADYQRNQYAFTIDYKLARNDRVTLGYQWSSFFSNSMGRNLFFNITQVDTFGPTFTHSKPGGGNLQMATANGIDRLNRTHMPTFTWRHDGPIWKAEAGAALSLATNHIRGVDKGFFNTESAQRTGVTVNFDDIFYLRPREITVTDTSGKPVDPYSLSSYTMNSFTAERRNPSDEQVTYYANVRRDFYTKVPFSLKTGVDVRRLTRQYRNHTLPLTFVGPDGKPNTADDNAAPFLDPSFSQRTSPYGFPKVQWVGPETSYDIYVAHPDWFTSDAAAEYTTLTNTSKRAEELVSAAFLRGDVQFFDRRLKLIGGLRAEQTDVEAHALMVDPSRNVQTDASGKPILVNGKTVPITTDPYQSLVLTRIERGTRTDKEFLTLFPNINASFNIRENLILRSAYYYSIGRPDLGQYAGGVTLPNIDALPSPSDRIVVNNAGIKPWTAKTVNVRLEYYFQGVGSVSVGAFRRDFRNFFGGVTFPATPEFLALYGLNPTSYGGYLVQTQENLTDTVRMTGVDMNYKQALTFLPHWARGVQVFANASAMRAEGPAITSFTGLNLIPRTANWGVALTREKFNLHVNWNYRGRQRQGLVTGQGLEPGTYNWMAKRLQIDVLGEFYLTRRIALFANLRNVNDGPIDLKAAGPNTPAYAQFTSRNSFSALWTFGLKGTW